MINSEENMKKHILHDLDEVCREMMACVQSTQRMISEKRIRRLDVAEKMSGMVVDMGSLLLELQQNSTVLGGETERLKAIAQLSSSCKNLEGMIKEIRNDLNAGNYVQGEPPAKDR
jgi:signal-transduction protein with cAMP-binding, CBS, and nucleotidyltransferase domain